MAAVAVADVMVLNVNERAAELATLKAHGWADLHLARLTLMEAAGLGLLGAVPGAAVGAVAAAAAGATLASSAGTAVLSALGGTVLAIAAGLIPAWRTGRRAVTAALAAD